MEISILSKDAAAPQSNLALNGESQTIGHGVPTSSHDELNLYALSRPEAVSERKVAKARSILELPSNPARDLEAISFRLLSQSERNQRSHFASLHKSSSLVFPTSTFMPSTAKTGDPSNPRSRRRSLPAITASSYLPSLGLQIELIMSQEEPDKTSRPLEQKQDSSVRDLTRPRPLFHLHGDFDLEDEVEGRFRSLEGPGTDSNDHVIGDERAGDNKQIRERTKDIVRRYHALVELLATEVGYLEYLRTFVCVYLCRMQDMNTKATSSSSIKTFGRSSTVPVITSSQLQTSQPSHLLKAQPASSITRSSDPPGTSLALNTKDKDKNIRPIFSEAEHAQIVRNVEDILQLHETFVEELQAAVSPFGFSLSSDVSNVTGSTESLDEAINAVATKFTTQASRFQVYQLFCSRHLTAVDIVKKAQRSHPVDWEGFETSCSALVSELQIEAQSVVSPQRTVVDKGHDTITREDEGQEKKARRRAYSASSAEGCARTWRPRIHPNVKNIATAKSETGSPIDKSGLGRLTFFEYMIKPVQRICQYHLLLNTLKSAPGYPKSHKEMDTDVVVESALQAMKHVAKAVDDARHRHDVAVQSALIVSRLLSDSQSSPFFQTAHARHLDETFLRTLGACLLAGSLDVVQYPVNGSVVKVKYLGAFLYLGGYLILAKIGKGKAYEPKHWFSLLGVELHSLEDTDAILPCSFQLSAKGHQFELAAPCQREKIIWINAINEAMACPPGWDNEPVSSLQLHGEDDVESCSHHEALPTIQSIPELGDNDNDVEDAERPDQMLSSAPSIPPTCQDQIPHLPPPTRRSSSNSSKGNLVATEAESYTIRRTSTTARSQVDLALFDVTSSICHAARAHAISHDEELFKAPQLKGLARSNSGISVASAIGLSSVRLGRHDTLVFRRKSLLDPPVGPRDGEKFGNQSRKFSAAGPSPTRRRLTQRLNLTSLTVPDGHHGARCASPESPVTRLSSSTSTTGSILSSPGRNTRRLSQQEPSSDSLPIPGEHEKPKRSRSMVDCVKGLFSARSTQSDPGDVIGVESSPKKQPNIPAQPRDVLKMLSGEALRHRRAKSTPYLPDELLHKENRPEPTEADTRTVGLPLLPFPQTNDHPPPNDSTIKERPKFFGTFAARRSSRRLSTLQHFTPIDVS